MKKLQYLITLLFLLGGSIYSQAQNTPILPARNVSLVMEVATENPPEIIAAISDDPDRSLDEVLFNKKVIINLFRLAGLSKIHVKLGSAPGATDYGQELLALGGGSNNLIVNGKTLFVDMGQIEGYPSIHVEVILEDDTGALSEPQYFIPTN